MIDSMLPVISRLGLAVLIGGVIGLDRAYRGRSAGFRTHILVCLASSVLMLLMDYQWQLVPSEYREYIRVDPTRMAQGIMTGIGFLGAGVIMQDKLVIRGLTTAASIWITSAIGIIIGLGLYMVAILVAAFTLLILVGLNNFTRIFPIRHYARLSVSFKRHECITEEELERLLEQHGLQLSNFAYRLKNDGKLLSYEVTAYTSDTLNYRRVAQSLLHIEPLQNFSLWPSGD